MLHIYFINNGLLIFIQFYRRKNITTKSTTSTIITTRSQRDKLMFKLLLLLRLLPRLLLLQRAFLTPKPPTPIHLRLNHKLLMSQLMRSELLLLRYHQHTSTTMLSLLLLRVSERLSDMTLSTQSSRRIEMRRKTSLTTTTSLSA